MGAALRRFSWLILVAVGALAGCGGPAIDLPELSEVTGTVTLNGTPLEGAVVSFVPQGNGTVSSGLTDARGQYSLRYRPGIAGAVPGDNLVQISKPGAEAGDDLLPSKFHQDSKMMVVVSAPKSVHDFQLVDRKK